MNKNKIAGLVLAGAIISGASTGASSSIIKSPIKTKTSTKNEKLLVADQSVEMDSTAVVVNGDNSLVLKNNVNGSIVSYLSAGEMLHITSKIGNYYKVTVEETGATGFISASNVEIILNGENSNFTSLNENGHVINVSSEVHLRGKASLNSNIIGFLKNGDNFKILGKEGQWYKVNSNGHIGFIFEEYVAKDSNTTIPVNTNVSTSTPNNKTVNSTVTYSNEHSANTSKNTMVENTTVKNNKVQEVKPSITSENINNTANTNNNNNNNVTKNTNNNTKNTKNATTVVKTVSHNNNNNIAKKNNEKSSVIHLINNSNSETGTATIKLIDTNTSIPLANKSVSIDGKNLTTNSKGEVSLIKLKPGQTTLNISSSNYNATTLKLDVIANKNVDATVRLTPDNGTALLTFLNAGNSRAIAHINVSIDGTTYTTNSKGEILLKDLEPGNHTLSISAKGFNDTTAKVNITPDGKVIGNINLYPKENLISFISLNQNLNKKVDNSSLTTNTNKAVKETENKPEVKISTINSTSINTEKTKTITNADTNKTSKEHVTVNTDDQNTKENNNNVVKNTNNTTKNNGTGKNDNITENNNNSNNNVNTTSKKNSTSTIAKSHNNSSESVNHKENNKVSTNNNNANSNNSKENNNENTHVVNNNNSNNNTVNTSSGNNHKIDNNNTNNNNRNHVVNIHNNENTHVANNNSNINNNKKSEHVVNTNNSSNSNKNVAPKKQQNVSSNNNESTAQLQQAIVKYAEQFLGRPYVWGATGPNAFDCSGLTSYVYRHFGYNIGRTTYQQIDAGTPVSLNDLQPGDLLFFGNPEAPDHVVMYIGNHQYIQAPQPGQCVDISSWNWGGIVAARRIV